MSKASPRHVIRLTDLDADLLEDILQLSERLRKRSPRPELAGRTIGGIFFRRSLRTRASFEAAVHRLGGHMVQMSAQSDLWDLESRDGVVMDGRAPEHVRDAAAVLSSFMDALAIRPKPEGNSWAEDRKDEQILSWARHSSVPVINMESAMSHPLQALADLLTLRQNLGRLAGKKLCILWTWSPEASSPAVVHSVLHAAVSQGMHVSLAHPAGYELDAGVMDKATNLAAEHSGSIELTDQALSGVKDAQVVYARSWASLDCYGNKTRAAGLASRNTDWRIDENLLTHGKDTHLMHAMPVRRNAEVADEVLDGPRSLLYKQAENRLWSQMALLQHLLRQS